MASAYKALGQILPAAVTNTTLYTVPAATAAVASTLTICNQGTNASVRVAVRPAGAALTAVHYVIYDNWVSQYDTLFLTIGLTLAATDVVTVYASTATVSFHLYGSEITG